MRAGDRGVCKDDVVLRPLADGHFILCYVALHHAAVAQYYAQRGFRLRRLSVVFWHRHSRSFGRLLERRAVRSHSLPRRFRRRFMRFKRSRRLVYVNLAQRRGDWAQIGPALVTKPAYFTRDRGLALRTYVYHSGYVKVTHACGQAVKIIL